MADLHSGDADRQVAGLPRSASNRIALSLNNAHMCTLGVEHDGGLALFVKYAHLAAPNTEATLPIPPSIAFEAVGFEGVSPNLRELTWVTGNLTVGDELTYLLLPPGEYDPPAEVAGPEPHSIERRTPHWQWPAETTGRAPIGSESFAPGLEGKVNGSLVCTATVNTHGFAYVVLTYTSYPRKVTEDRHYELIAEGRDGPDGHGQRLHWETPEVKLGDIISIRVINAPGELAGSSVPEKSASNHQSTR